MHNDVVAEVVAMIADRGTRNLLGFDFETCIRRKLPPCRLPPIDYSFAIKLVRLYPARLCPYTCLNQFKRDMQTILSISYLENEELIELQLFKGVEIVKDRDMELYIWTYNEHRSYLIGRFSRSIIHVPPEYGTKVFKISDVDR